MGHKNPDSAREHRHHQASPEALETTQSRNELVKYAVKLVAGSVYTNNQRIWHAVEAEDLHQMANEQAGQQLADMPVSTMAGNTVVNAVIDTSPDVDSTLDINSAPKLDPAYYANFQEEPA